MQATDRTEQLLAQLSNKLDLLIKVVGIQTGPEKSTTERARLLKMAGLDNQTIADILNTSPATIRAVTSNLRTKRRSS